MKEKKVRFITVTYCGFNPAYDKLLERAIPLKFDGTGYTLVGAEEGGREVVFYVYQDEPIPNKERLENIARKVCGEDFYKVEISENCW